MPDLKDYDTEFRPVSYFVTDTGDVVSSEFYSELGEYYEEAAQEWLVGALVGLRAGGRG